ncbi:hypothetical protein NM22_09225 [Vibrio tubiashii]|nr:hypothetical protein NM22_09225 [Vibrio tubiashii]
MRVEVKSSSLMSTGVKCCQRKSIEFAVSRGLRPHLVGSCYITSRQVFIRVLAAMPLYLALIVSTIQVAVGQVLMPQFLVRLFAI